MDIKMGVRTFLEEEVTKQGRRMVSLALPLHAS
jgi:hypothetical protein